ncbi:hypothetical protein [Dyadobacter fermentans]|uniref:hypothetical protein n=1 Tax=Dyadobacter fermentans TaxID=94254 RepID=UPI001CBF5E16|nr:hypothetical protein [Dyadobacter fermentans]MBZ1361989.1 hypothetical protein [Dyadobacter fermentans]
MSIAQLPEGLRQLAELRRQQAGRDESDNLGRAFSWANTDEGYWFWNAVYHGMFATGCVITNIREKRRGLRLEASI